MPKPTISIGGRITRAELDEITQMIAEEWRPCLAWDEHGEATSEPPATEDLVALRGFYQSLILGQAQADPEPLRFSTYDRGDDIEQHAIDAGLWRWLQAREDRLAVHLYDPGGAGVDGSFFSAFMRIFGVGAAPYDDFARCDLTDLGDPCITIADGAHVRSDEEIVQVARDAMRVFRFEVPPLIIED